MILHEARKLADRITGILSPFCERIEVAGSIRRARPHVNDMDIVCLVKPGQEDALRQRCKLKATVLQDGRQRMSLMLPIQMKLDIFFAHAGVPDLMAPVPSNWGAQLLTWTGSAAHNVWMNERARAMGMMLRAGHGLVTEPDTVREKIIASATEEEIFGALGMEWIPPVMRERGVPNVERANPSPQSAADWAEAFLPVP